MTQPRRNAICTLGFLLACAILPASGLVSVERLLAADAPAAGTPDDLKAKRAKVADEIAAVTKAKEAAKAAGEKTAGLDALDAEIGLLGALRPGLCAIGVDGRAPRRAGPHTGAARGATGQPDEIRSAGAEALFVHAAGKPRGRAGHRDRAGRGLQGRSGRGTRSVAQARTNLEHAQAAERQASDRLSANHDPSQQNELATAVHLADVGSTIAAETVNLRRAEIEVKTTLCDLGDQYQKLLSEKKKLVEPETHFGPADHQALIDNLGRKEQEFQAQLAEAKNRLSQNESQQQIDLAKLAGDKADAAVVTAATFAHRRVASVVCEQIVQLEQRLNESRI